jgi:ABC-type glutathione transport system ATPase component
MTVADIQAQFSEARVRRKFLQDSLDDKIEKAVTAKELVANQVKARWVLTEVAQLTQTKFKAKVESLVTMAIQSVFDRPFQFHLEFERKRNKMECRPVVTEIVDGQERIYEDPENDMGGGAMDIISFAFRIVLWSLERPPSRNVIILDEPMKNMGKLITLGGQVLREISHKLGFQLVIITHEDELIDIADRSYQVLHDGNKSRVELVKGEPVDVTHKRVRIQRPAQRDKKSGS